MNCRKRHGVAQARNRALVGLVAALVLVACGGADTAQQPAAEATPDTASPATSLGLPSDDALVPLADGSEFDLNSLRNKEVLLWFWAPW